MCNAILTVRGDGGGRGVVGVFCWVVAVVVVMVSPGVDTVLLLIAISHSYKMVTYNNNNINNNDLSSTVYTDAYLSVPSLVCIFLSH